MSTPSPALRISDFFQISSPVFWSSANALSAVAP
jgi:hypothetical protein